MYAVAGAIFVALITILSIKLGKTENRPWSYPFVLATFPLFYFGFALYGNDTSALMSELIFSIPIFLIAIICSFKNIRFSGFILGSGFILHGLYDFYHHLLFMNSGSPIWWPEFCGTIDILIGVYLFVITVKLPNQSVVQKVSV